MANRYSFVIDVVFDTPDGIVNKRYFRKNFRSVVNLLDSFDLLPLSISISFKRI